MQEFVIRLAHTAADHSNLTVQRLKNALSKDESTRKEAAASRESSGGVPDVGLASILRNRSLSQTVQNIDIDTRILFSDKQKFDNSGDLENTLNSYDDNNLMSNQHKIRSKGLVAEMTEEGSENEDCNCKYTPRFI